MGHWIRVITQVKTGYGRTIVIIGRAVGIKIKGGTRNIAALGPRQNGHGPCLAWSQFQSPARKAVRAAIGQMHARARFKFLRSCRKIEIEAPLTEAYARIGFFQRHPTGIARPKGIVTCRP